MLFQSTYFDDANVNKFYNTFNLNKVRDFFNDYVNGKNKNKKMQYISMHENNITSILNLLGYQSFEEIEKRFLG